jgi:nitrile hydratase subunit beta
MQMPVVHHNPALYKIGDLVHVSVRFPVGHYRVPMYMRGKQVEIIRILGLYVNPEEEAFGRNAGNKMWCYMIRIPQNKLWSGYAGDEGDTLEVEIFESWLEEIKN